MIDDLVTHEHKRQAVEAVVKALADARLLTVS
jgi:hypothetical protein